MAPFGACAAVDAGFDGEPFMAVLKAVLSSRRSTKSPLFRQSGSQRGRSLFPNFATEIYSVLAALADHHGRVGNDSDSISEARQLADLLIELRREDGGWPWIYHAEKSAVVEPYQIYSVHQDAMAPMAMFALTDATGDMSYARSAVEGLPWCFGQNEMNFNFYDSEKQFAHRAIKRKGWADRIELWSNTALAVSPWQTRLKLGAAEINATCRPYHLGWVLEAWCGREDYVRHPEEQP